MPWEVFSELMASIPENGQVGGQLVVRTKGASPRKGIPPACPPLPQLCPLKGKGGLRPLGPCPPSVATGQRLDLSRETEGIRGSEGPGGHTGHS